MFLKSLWRLQLVTFNKISGTITVHMWNFFLYEGIGGIEGVLLSFAHLHFCPLVTVFSVLFALCSFMHPFISTLNRSIGEHG